MRGCREHADPPMAGAHHPAPQRLPTARRQSLRIGSMGLLSALLGLLPLVGCDQRRIDQLQPNISTEAEVRAAFGAPDAEYTEPDGSRLLSYPRQPEGRTNLMVVLSPSGFYRETRQVLQPGFFRRIEPGMDTQQVLRTLGRPAKRQTYALKQQTEWDWHWLDGQTRKTFTVVFDAQQRVLGTAISDDRRAEAP